MPTNRNEISRGEPGRLNEQLTGRVWLTQKLREWPVTLWTGEGHVLSVLKDPEQICWEYEITPVRRVVRVDTEPRLAAVLAESEPAWGKPTPSTTNETEPVEKMLDAESCAHGDDCQVHPGGAGCEN
jgi:hypothetical protein